MKKIFKLAFAEFHKIFYRPSIFILTALLIGTLVFTNLFYNPTNNNSKLNYSASNVTNLYSQFTQTSSQGDTKTSIDQTLESAKQSVVNDFEAITNTDVLQELNDKIHALYNGNLQGTFRLEIQKISLGSFSSSAVQSAFKYLERETSSLLTFMASSIKGKTINFYLTLSEYDTLYNYLLDFHDSIPISFAEYRQQNYIDRANHLFNNFDFKPVFEITSNLKKITIDDDAYFDLIDTYYTKAKQTLNSKFEIIKNYAQDHSTSNEQSHMDELNELCAQYYSYANTNAKILTNSFLLQRIGTKSDTELKSLVGYSDTSKYALTEEVTICKYLIESNTYDYNYLSSFNFNQVSGLEPNAFDYTIYTMQILTILIAIFTIFYACSSIAGDQSNGTMKMIAIRPFSRNKLFTGKYLSCFMFATLLTFISFVASFVVGMASFGIPTLDCLVAWNAVTIVPVNPFILLLAYFVSCLVNIIFFISVAMIICLLFKNNTLSVLLSSIVYGTGIILNAFTSGTWLKYTPFGHLDLFKFFGNSSAGFLSFNLLPDSNVFTSALIIGFSIVVMNFISHIIFSRRNIA